MMTATPWRPPATPLRVKIYGCILATLLKRGRHIYIYIYIGATPLFAPQKCSIQLYKGNAARIFVFEMSVLAIGLILGKTGQFLRRRR